MIEAETSFKITAWIRLGKGNGIGIPIFTDGSNTEYFPETDNRLRIVVFHPFFNDEGYTVERQIPERFKNLIFKLGDGVPIPFIEDEILNIADSMLSSLKFVEKYLGRSVSSVVQQVAEVLRNSENGIFEVRNLHRQQRKFSIEFPSLFDQEAVHSRYWIEKFEEAAIKVGKQSQNIQQDLKDHLIGLAYNWFDKFAMSGDVPLIELLIEIVRKRLDIDQVSVKIIYFSIAVKAFSINADWMLVNKVFKDQLLKHIPEGVYYLERKMLNVNQNMFPRQKKVDFVNLMYQTVTSGYYTGQLDRSLTMAIILFGSGPLPRAIREQILRIRDGAITHLEDTVKGRFLPETYRAKSEVLQMLTTYEKIKTLSQILSGKNRAVGPPKSLKISRSVTVVLEDMVKRTL